MATDPDECDGERPAWAGVPLVVPGNTNGYSAVKVLKSIVATPVGMLRQQCRLAPDFTADDGMLGRYWRAACDLVRTYSGRLVEQRTVVAVLDGFPRGDGLLALPFDSIYDLSITYWAADGTQKTLHGYQTSWPVSQPLVVGPAPGSGWPETQAGRVAAVKATANCGYRADDMAVQAALLAVGYWYGFRGDGGDPERQGLPPAALRLLDLLDTGEY